MRLLVCLILGALASWWMGQDANFDLKLYHLYNPFALFEGRHEIDFAPAAFHGFFTPFSDIPYYLLATKLLPDFPRIVAAIQGLYFGALTYLVLRVNELLLPRWSALIATVIGITGVATVSEIGTTFNDIPISALIVGGLFLLLREDIPHDRHAIIAGLMFGLAAGIKLYTGYYIAAAVIALLLVARWHAIRAAFLLSLSTGVMFLLTYGWWALHLWRTTGNPLFPYFNGVFRSPYFLEINFNPNNDPFTWIDWIAAPIRWTGLYVGDQTNGGFRDARTFLAYVAAIILAAFLMLASRSKPNQKRQAFLLAFAAISYFLWLTQFRIFRYAMPLEVLSGTFMLLALQRLDGFLPGRYFGRPITFGGIIALLLYSTTNYLSFGRVPYRERVLTISAPTLPANSMVIIVGAPMAYILALLDAPGMSAVGVTWLNLLSEKVSEEVARRLREHDGPKFVLLNPYSKAELDRNRGISLSWSDCVPILTSLDDDILICEAKISTPAK